jgi:hypothetical protein
MTMIPVPIPKITGEQIDTSNISDKIDRNYSSLDSVQAINDHIYDVGDEDTFWVDFELTVDSEYKPENATCKYISDEAYIFLKNGLEATQNFVEIGNNFDDIMIPIITDTFAEPSDIDGNDRVVILLTSLALGIGGYFSPRDLHGGVHPYNGEIVYINAQSSSLDSTLIHELQHLVKSGYDSNELIWFNEGCSKLSEALFYLAGIENESMSLFTPTGVSLLYWDYENARADTDYAAVKSFLVYLYDQYGSANLSAIYQASTLGQKLQGIDAIMFILHQYFPTLTFEQLVQNWIIASIVDKAYTGDIREYYFENFDCGPNSIKFPQIGDINAKMYPYNENWNLIPWETKIYQFRNFIDPNQINISITVPTDSQDHLFGVNIIKEVKSNDSFEFIIESVMLTETNIADGYYVSYNASEEGFDHLYLTISHLDGGEGYYWDIPSSEHNVEVNVEVNAGIKASDTSTTTPNQTSFEIPFILLLLLGLVINQRKKKN